MSLLVNFLSLSHRKEQWQMPIKSEFYWKSKRAQAKVSVGFFEEIPSLLSRKTDSSSFFLFLSTLTTPSQL